MVHTKTLILHVELSELITYIYIKYKNLVRTNKLTKTDIHCCFIRSDQNENNLYECITLTHVIIKNPAATSPTKKTESKNPFRIMS